ncbi:VC0807 family protein [Virgibacillus salexigens]|uniref:VC0807 family protein n=1 Tax=Virgibacillus massiliensis TaxID=1462526 RepID=UPI001369B965|nr:VC0807 family protein [Virgibacillus massiliensis]MYL42946.1 hypothetical protein [Virgibacillus massiliensis]
MQKNIVIWDLICYLAFPLLVWNVLRDYIGDYPAMLLSTIPGIVYSCIRFFAVKKINMFGIFMIVTLIASTLVNVLAGSAIQMLWNNVYYAFAMAAFFLFTILIKRPLVLLFTLDFTELQGQSRKKMKKIFYEKRFYMIFNLITFGFAMREVILGIIKVRLISAYGIEAFDKGLIIRNILSWGITALCVLGFIYISKLLHTQTANYTGKFKTY